MWTWRAQRFLRKVKLFILIKFNQNNTKSSYWFPKANDKINACFSGNTMVVKSNVWKDEILTEDGKIHTHHCISAGWEDA